jgi:hypothetical protein
MNCDLSEKYSPGSIPAIGDDSESNYLMDNWNGIAEIIVSLYLR